MRKKSHWEIDCKFVKLKKLKNPVSLMKGIIQRSFNKSPKKCN